VSTEKPLTRRVVGNEITLEHQTNKQKNVFPELERAGCEVVSEKRQMVTVGQPIVATGSRFGWKKKKTGDCDEMQI
jgi:hypothetical protein